ncbi:hypothetical protein HYR99_35765 [Candidatus Poribacteria bacterium]|nr:hypothetical protein [Candidatus Poribacteria bacterium]
MRSQERSRQAKDKKAHRLITAELAQDIAADFLLMKVGNLLMAGEPRLPRRCVNSKRGWKVPILLGNVRGGVLGKVGELFVEAETGEVVFTPEERNQIEVRANALYQRSQAS